MVSTIRSHIITIPINKRYLTNDCRDTGIETERGVRSNNKFTGKGLMIADCRGVLCVYLHRYGLSSLPCILSAAENS